MAAAVWLMWAVLFVAYGSACASLPGTGKELWRNGHQCRWCWRFVGVPENDAPEPKPPAEAPILTSYEMLKLAA